MPDLWLLTYSFIAAAVCAAVGCIATCLRGHSPNRVRASGLHLQVLCGFVVGIVAGLAVQGVVPAVPPVTGLDRWLLIGFPLLLSADAFGARWLSIPSSGLLRLSAAAVAAPIILYGSIHFEAVPAVPLLPGLTAGGLFTVIAVGCLLVTMTALNDHSATEHPLLAAAFVVLTLQVAAATVMLGGWIRGGAAALPFAGSCTGILLASPGLRNPLAAVLVIRWGVWSLCGVVLLGHFFGRLSVLQSLLLLAAAVTGPLLTLPTRRIAVRFRATIRCILTLLLLALVLIPAILQFLARMKPLLSEWSAWTKLPGS